jgi:O-antigen ligase
MRGQRLPAQLPAQPGTQAPRVARLRFSKDPLRILLFLLTIVTISKIHALFGFLAVLRPAMTLALLTLIYAWMNPKHLASGKVFKTWPPRVIAGLGLMACLSVPFGLSMGGSAMFVVSEYSKTLLFAFLLIVAIRDANDLYTLFWAYVISCGFLTYLAIFVYHVSSGPGGHGIARISGGFSYDANDICVLFLIGLALTLLAFQTAQTKGKIFCLCVLLAMGMAIARSGSRGGFLGLVAVGAALLVTVKSISFDKKIMAVVLLGVGIIVMAPVGYWDQMRTILSPKQDYNYTSETGRVEIAKRGIEYMLTHPLTGIGVNNFQRAEGTIADRAVAAHEEGDGVRWNAAHNTLVQAGSEMGIPGLVLMMTLMYGGIFAMVRLRKRLPKEWETGDAEERFLYQSATFLPIALLGFGISGVLVSFAYLDPIYMLGAYMTGLYVSVDAKMRKNQLHAGAAVAAPAPRRYRGGLAPHPTGSLPRA